MALVKTTLEIPDQLFRQLKISAAKQGKTIRTVVNEALVEKLNRASGQKPDLPAWRSAFGGLRSLHNETFRISGETDAEFSRLNPGDWK
jgi:hypothetical protein